MEMLFVSSLVVLVGSGHNPAFSTRKLMIRNTKNASTICELTFVTSVLSVRLNKYVNVWFIQHFCNAFI